MSDDRPELNIGDVVGMLERIALCLEQIKDKIGTCPHGYTICPVCISQALRGT